LPRKLLLKETGISLIQHTYQAASKSQQADALIVAADDEAIVAEVKRFGGQVMLTDVNHQSGTDRVAEIASRCAEFEIIVNVQGDEPELPGATIDAVVAILEQNPDAQMATLATPIRDRQQLNNPNCVKVVVTRAGKAMYFSRSPIPCPRQWDDRWLISSPPNFLQHIGLYAYRREFLLQIPLLEKSPLESIESLEQLRILHAGVPIHVGLVEHFVGGIDTPEDYAAFVSRHGKG
jgi:3-deoxy-manno-octulosonate cytidylyltransferase (CMP-KDO synthetase)